MNRKPLFMLPLTLFLLCVLISAHAEGVSVDAPVSAIKVYGNVILPITGEALAEAGFNLGDIVDVTFGETTVAMPYCTNYSEVDSGCPVLVYRSINNDHVMAVYNSDFASTYAFAAKTDDGWTSSEGDTVHVSITMNTPGGYYDQFVIRSIVYTDNREDYANLTDAEFANFREVATTGIAPGTLYRSVSPIDNKHNRAAYAATAMEKAGVQVVLNLANSEETMSELEAYANSYYAAANVIGFEMGMDFAATDNMTMLADELRFTIANEGPILIHCLEGKDRTGFVCAILERLAGASFDEMVNDYMTTYENYYGLTAYDEAYALIAHSFEMSMTSLLGTELDAEGYLINCGLTTQEVAALTARLTGK